MDLYKKEILLNRYRSDAKLHTYRNLRRAIVKNINVLKKLDEAPGVYGNENFLVYENTAFKLEHLFACAYFCFCINGIKIDDMSHINYTSVYYCEEKLKTLDEKWIKIRSYND